MRNPPSLRLRALAMSALLVFTLAAIVAGGSSASGRSAASAGSIQKVVAASRIVYLKDWWVPGASIWIAHGDGSHPRELVKSRSPWAIAFARLSPNGKLVDYFQGSTLPDGGARAVVIPATGGKARQLAWNASVLIWSPDSRSLAAIIHTGAPPDRLVAIDVASGKLRVLARAPCIETPGFSPDGRQLVYAAGQIPRTGVCHDDLYTVPVTGGRIHRLTKDHHSSWPVWGPRWIAFSRWRDIAGRDEYPSLESLVMIRPSGGPARTLTALRPSGPRPVAWSADGNRLLVNVGDGAATVDPATGKLKAVGRVGAGVSAIGLSRDGSTILGTLVVSSAYDGVNVVTLPYRGGALRTLLRHANDPSWDR